MLRTIDLRGTHPTDAELATLLPRSVTDVSSAIAAAATLIEDVRTRGLPALLEQAERFDRVRPTHVRVEAETLATAAATLDPRLRAAIDIAITRVRGASAVQVPPPQRTTLAPGAVIEQRWQPVERVGLYVPGGKAVYPSSVVMNVVAAQAAGVPSIALASPPQADHGGSIHPTIAAVAHVLGVTEVYAMGGAGALGAFAYGVPALELAPVQAVTGPGNVFVAAAKRHLAGVVRTDAEAGPTDILVLADATADPEFVAADLLSQAEHDELAASVLVTWDAAFATAVTSALTARAAATRHRERVQAALTGPQSATVLVRDLAQATAVVNVFAPEHLEIVTESPETALAGIRNAGAIFLGPHAPVPLGDYLAGSNHVLPTGGTARWTAGLSAMTFLRPQQVVRYTAEGLGAVAADIIHFAAAEDLPAHGAAITARFPDAVAPETDGESHALADG